MFINSLNKINYLLKYKDVKIRSFFTNNYSIRTEKTYVIWIKRFIIFLNKCHPQEMGELEVNRFLSHLAVKRMVASFTQRKSWKIYLCKKTKRLSVVFAKEESNKVLENLKGTKWIIEMLLFGSG